MSLSKTTARIVGALFLTTFITNIISGEIIEPILNAPNYLAHLYPNKTQVNIAVLFELISAVALTTDQVGAIKTRIEEIAH